MTTKFRGGNDNKWNDGVTKMKQMLHNDMDDYMTAWTIK
jgi:hypothetical protein